MAATGGHASVSLVCWHAYRYRPVSTGGVATSPSLPRSLRGMGS